MIFTIIFTGLLLVASNLKLTYHGVSVTAITLVCLVGGFLAWFLTWPAKNVRVKEMRACSFRPENVPKRIDTIVVGSGIGGLTCANLLAQSGQRVLVLEQNYCTGGCTHSFKENGCEWDSGLHYTSKDMATKTTRSGAIMNFITSGMQEWSNLEDPYDELHFPADNQVKEGLPNNRSYSFVSGAHNTVDEILASIDPTNDELRKRTLIYMDLCLEVNSGFTALGISRILPPFLLSLVSKKIERLYKLAAMNVRDVQYAIFNLGYDADELLRTCPKAPDEPEVDPIIRRLKAIFTHPIGDYAVEPKEASFVAHGGATAHYSRGAAYTVGPTQKISLRTLYMVREFGGDVLTDAYVHDIIIEDGRAVGVHVSNTSNLNTHASTSENLMESSTALTEIRCRNVVWASGIFNLYKKALPQSLPQVKDFHNPRKRTCEPSDGHNYLFCKIQGDASELGLPSHNLWWFNGYDVDDAFDKYFANPKSEKPQNVYIGFPCTKDPTWNKRFPGVSNCILISSARYEWFEEWEKEPIHHRSEAYDNFKKKLSENLVDVLYEVVPQVKGKVEFQMLGTPLTESGYFASFKGGSYGTKVNCAMFNETNRKWTTTPRTEIPGLFLAGSDAFLPSVCGAMHGGCFGAIAILGYVRSLRLGWAFLGSFAASLKDDDPSLTWPRAYYLASLKCVSDNAS
jgi:all-trans-retinol 13,14-reductase